MDRFLNMDFLQDTMKKIRLAWRVMWDPRVPLQIRSIPFLAILYVVSPIDLIPGFIPILGQADDIAIVIFSISTLLRLAPQGVVDEHRASMEISG